MSHERRVVIGLLRSACDAEECAVTTRRRLPSGWMAAVSGPARHSRVSMSVSMSLMQGGAQSAPQGAILAAAAPYYQAPAIPTDVQPDRPIGYGAFGVVW